MKKKKEEEILQFIKTFHSRGVTQISKGKYVGYWHTRIGIGREDSKYIRTRTLMDMLDRLAAEYGVSKPGTMTLDDYFDHWMEWKAERNGNKASTAKHNRNCYTRFVEGTKLAKTPITAITTEALDDWARGVLKTAPLSAKRFNTIKIVVTGPLTLAVRENIISESPWKPLFMDYFVLLKAERKAPSNEKIFYDDEIQAIISKCMADYEEGCNVSNMAIIFNFDMGLRVGELAALKWEDVDWKRKVINIRRQESQGEIEEYVKSDSPAGYRELPLNDYLIGLLQRVKNDTGATAGYIFADEHGNRKTVAALQKRLIYAQVGKDGDGAGSHVKRIHCQRRTVATKIAQAKGIEAARQWLGHTDLQTTLKYIYTTETTDSLREFSQEESALRGFDADSHPA